MKYYKVTLKNIFLSNSQEDRVFAVLEGNRLSELLTNKRIYLAREETEFNVNTFTNGGFKLIGTEVQECVESDIGMFLKFITVDKKESVIEMVNNQENSILNVLNKLDFYESNYVKKVKKSKFLRNY